MDTLGVVILVSVRQAHGLGEQAVPASLGNVLLCVHVVAGIVLHEEVQGGATDGLFFGGLSPAVVGAVALVTRHMQQYSNNITSGVR